MLQFFQEPKKPLEKDPNANQGRGTNPDRIAFVDFARLLIGAFLIAWVVSEALK